MRAHSLLLALALVSTPAMAADDADRRLMTEVCAADGAAAVLAGIAVYERDALLQPEAIAEALGAADALAERGYCRSAAVPAASFAAYKASRPETGRLDEAFARGRLFARPPRSGSARFDGSFLGLAGPGRPLVRQ